jgi:hypothetical protein
MSMPEPIPNIPVGDPVRRWAARAWSAVSGRIGGGRRLSVYAFGKHPAFADFIDVGRLPPVPAGFRHFHDRLRTAVERDGGPAAPHLIGWSEGGHAAVLWVQPSRDRGDATTGRFRRCPLLLGVSGRAALAELLAIGGARLERLAEDIMGDDAEGVLERIRRAAADWPPADERAGPPDGVAARAAAAVRQGTGAKQTLVIADAERVAVEAVHLSMLTTVAFAGRLRMATDAPVVQSGPRAE